MSELGAAAGFAAQLYRYRAQTALDAYVRRNKLALLQMRPGRVNPYAIYGQLRTAGTVFPGTSDSFLSRATTSTVPRNSKPLFASANARSTPDGQRALIWLPAWVAGCHDSGWDRRRRMPRCLARNSKPCLSS